MSGSVLLNSAQWDVTLARLQDAGWAVEHAGQDLARVAHPADLGSQVTLTHKADTPEGNSFDIMTKLGAAQMDSDLAASVPAGIAVDKVLIGFNWVFIRAGAYCGIARSPDRGTEGARTIRPEQGFGDHQLHDLAGLLCSLDPLSRAVGLAAVNAYWNRPDEVMAHRAAKGGFAAMTPPGDGVVIIGGFRGAQKRLPNAKIVEREPKPGDIPAAEAAPAMQAAQTLAITGQTLMNASLAPLLRTAGANPRKVLIGPSVPLCPVLFDHGIDELSGAVIHTPDAAERFICESGAMIMRDEIAHSAYMNKDF